MQRQQNLCRDSSQRQRANITSGNEDAVFVLQQPITRLGEIGGLAHAVDAAKGDDVGSVFLLRLNNVSQNIHSSFRR